MKKTIALLIVSAFLFGCSKQSDTTKTVVPTKTQEEYIQSFEKQGIYDFYFEDNYLVYKVLRNKILADPDWVAKQYYEMAEDVEGIRGCILVNPVGQEFGRYEP